MFKRSPECRQSFGRKKRKGQYPAIRKVRALLRGSVGLVAYSTRLKRMKRRNYRLNKERKKRKRKEKS